MSRKRLTVADEPFLIVRTSPSNPRAGATIGAHAHDWHQLIYVRTGLMTVRTSAGSWITPPSWAVWVPAGVDHAIRFVDRSEFRTCYLRPARYPDVPARDPGIPDGCRALAVSPLLRELIARATEIGALDERVPVEAAVADLIVSELTGVGPPPFVLPEPSSAATMRAAALIIEAAPEAAGTATLARAVGVSVRTLERRFLAEAGMTLGRWRQQRSLLRGLERIAGGASIAEAATVAEYASPSAYIAAFKKAFGSTPARYFKPD